MLTASITFLVLLLIVTAMSVGILFGKKPISGSCGGLANLEPDRECELCGGNPSKCIEQ